MKLDKWTVALAAIGVVSFASAAKAEEKANTVQTALSSTTISGYVDTSAQWNLGTGNANLPPYRFGGASKADGFNLDVVQVRIEKPLDEAEWAAGYRVDLWAGPDANTLSTQSIFGNGSHAAQGDFALRQAYLALRTPVANGIDWKVGVFDSIIGYESVESPNNPNYTRSYGNTIEPQTHTGVLASYRFCDAFSASLGVANTYGPFINNRDFAPVQAAGNNEAESYKTYMGSVALTAPDSMGFLAGSTLYAGIVNGFDEHYTTFTPGTTDPLGAANATSYYVGATVATPVTGLRLGAAFDWLDVHTPTAFRGGATYTIAGYASFQATEKLSFHGRAEYLNDRSNQKFFTAPNADTGTFVPTAPNEVLALTGTVQYDLWKNVLSRLEVRWDRGLGGPNVWGGETVGAGDEKNAVMIAGNLIYKF
jgi:hypothetical protein